ncbi:MAG: hypothetical protein B7Z72_15240 [Gemmatimonadetes bacterium 21-71-4]|nr:MAG: hypothetical protein B7Z72_15240 [Gemmatimonadetes bacterium 21-71-4]
MTIDVTKVPVREPNMTPYEILLSESQERMLVVAIRGHEDAVREILEKWDLTAAVIGEVIASGCTGSTTPRCAPIPWSDWAVTRPCCAFAAPIAPSPPRRTATGGTRTSIPASAPASRWPKPRATWPAPAPGRWPSPIISTSAIRAAPRSTSSCARPWPAWARRAAPWVRRSPAATCRCTTRARAGPCIPRPSSG